MIGAFERNNFLVPRLKIELIKGYSNSTVKILCSFWYINLQIVSIVSIAFDQYFFSFFLSIIIPFFFYISSINVIYFQNWIHLFVKQALLYVASFIGVPYSLRVLPLIQIIYIS